METEKQNGTFKEEAALTTIQDVNFFQSKTMFEHAQRVANMLSQSDLVPAKFKGKIGNCVIALEMAYRMGASPLMIMQNLNIILGTPAWSSKFLIASLNACGRFSPLRYEEDEQNGGRARAWALDKKTGEKLLGAWVTMEMAKAEGWIDKNGSKWKTMPELMRRYRAASFFVNQYAPEISMGFQTVEEVYDIGGQSPVIDKADKEAERVRLMIEDCKTIEEVEALQLQLPEIDSVLFESRKSEINPDWNKVQDAQPEPQAISDELKHSIITCETIAQLNELWNTNHKLHNDKEFSDAINKQKIKIGKTLKGEKVL